MLEVVDPQLSQIAKSIIEIKTETYDAFRMNNGIVNNKQKFNSNDKNKLKLSSL